MKKGGDVMTMKDMEAGKFCGACHNGTKAFGVKDAASCAKCHKK
jgi:c(7)-type cytochrome triheme protein